MDPKELQDHPARRVLLDLQVPLELLDNRDPLVLRVLRVGEECRAHRVLGAALEQLDRKDLQDLRE